MIDGCDAYIDAGDLHIVFASGNRLTLARNEEFQRLVLTDADRRIFYYYNEVEERWFSVGGESDLRKDLAACLAAVAGTAVQFTEG